MPFIRNPITATLLMTLQERTKINFRKSIFEGAWHYIPMVKDLHLTKATQENYNPVENHSFKTTIS